ncbi:MAG TPA: hypothetical protein VHO06_08850, partial [Polyangia bacterium]|nr:hypothetical protein [Polyangia bacterium]
MTSHATKAGALALGLALVVGLGGCGNEPAGQAEQASGGLRGELSMISVLGSTGRSSVLYYLRPSDGSASVELLFDADPALASGTPLRVWGSAEGSGLRVSRYEVVPETAAAPIAAATPLSQTV